MRTSLFVAAAAISGIIVGFLIGASLATRVPLGAEASVEWHWKRVNDYRAFMRDPQNLHSTPNAGINALTPPYDPEPSYLALEMAGEIKCAEIILPTVPINNRIQLRLMGNFGPDVLEAKGLPKNSTLRVSGTPPLYMKIWYKKSALADIQKLIDDLEALASDQRVNDL